MVTGACDLSDTKNAGRPLFPCRASRYGRGVSRARRGRCKIDDRMRRQTGRRPADDRGRRRPHRARSRRPASTAITARRGRATCSPMPRRPPTTSAPPPIARGRAGAGARSGATPVAGRLCATGWRRCAAASARAYGVPDDVAIVFAPSGTDLEYVALACVAGRAPAGTNAVLLGADEVGSGCIHSAHGLYFAERDRARRRGRRRASRCPASAASMSTWSTSRSATAMAGSAPPPRSPARMRVLDRRGARRQPAQPGPYRPRLEDRPDPAVARRCRPAARGRRRDPGGRRLPGADHRRGGERLSGAGRDRLRHRLEVHGRPAVQRLRAGPAGAGRGRRRRCPRASPRSSAAPNGRRAGRAPRSLPGQRQYRPAAAARGVDVRAGALPGAGRRNGRAGDPRLPRRGPRRDRRTDRRPAASRPIRPAMSRMPTPIRSRCARSRRSISPR